MVGIDPGETQGMLWTGQSLSARASKNPVDRLLA
jgi:hypothetical protein